MECEHVVPKEVLIRCLSRGRSRCCDVQLSMEMMGSSSGSSSSQQQQHHQQHHQQFSVPHRSLAGWQRFVEMGAMPASSARSSSSSSNSRIIYDGQFDPYTLQSQIASNRLLHGREASQKAAVRRMLQEGAGEGAGGGGGIGGVYSAEDLEAASLLSGQN